MLPQCEHGRMCVCFCVCVCACVCVCVCPVKDTCRLNDSCLIMPSVSSHHSDTHPIFIFKPSTDLVPTVLDLIALSRVVHASLSVPFRATMIDTGRHYLPVAVIQGHIDAMAYNKMNVLHW